jgi:hypothetical protein
MQSLDASSNDSISQLLRNSLLRKSELLNQLINPKDFFVELANIYKFIASKNELVIILETMLSDYQKEFEETDKLSAQVQKELDLFLVKIKAIVIEHDFITEQQWNLIETYFANHMIGEAPELLVKQEAGKPVSIAYSIGDYYSVVHGHTQSLSGETKERMRLARLGFIVEAIFHTNPELVKDFVNLFVDDKGEKFIQDYNISATYREFENKRAITISKTEATPWFAFTRIQLVPLCMYDYLDYIEKFKQQNDIVQSMNLNMLVGEMKAILSERKSYSDNPTIFVVEKYRNYFHRIIDHILDVLDFSPPNLQTETTKPQLKREKRRSEPLIPPKSLPQNKIDNLFLKKFSFEADAKKGRYFLQYGSHLPTTFDLNSDVGKVFNTLAKLIGQWIHARDITQHVWPDLNYEEETSTKGKNLHKKIRDTISDIRIKTLKPHELHNCIIIESGHECVGDTGSNWFRLMLIAP